jgi:hypothetical protein
VEYRDLDFGKAAAEKEAAEAPQLLIEGYYDPHDVPSALLRGSTSLILGVKGSGKSAITEHLRLLAAKDPQLFVSRVALKDFPFSEFANIKGGGAPGQARYPSSWSWLLLLTVFDSFGQDQGAASNTDDYYQQTIRALTTNGFLPTPSLREAVLKSFKTTIKLKLPPLEGGAEESITRSGLHLFSAVETLRRVASNFHTDSTHVVTIDGLDEIFIHEQVQWDALAALILEADRLNSMFREHGVPANIVILCRTDVFARLQLADSNKIRQDSGVTLNWYPFSDRPQDSYLFGLAEKKASVKYPDLGDVIGRFFPEHISLAGGRIELSIHEYLLSRTRHTPRDYLRLLTYIQRTAPSTGRLDSDVIRAGARQYCVDYFVPEVRNELVGLLSEDDARNVMGLLSTMKGNRFLLEDLKKKAQVDDRYQSLNVNEAVSQLFNCSAIGNEVPDRRESYFNFSYRNPEVEFDPTQIIVMHNGLVTGLNVPRRFSRE